jgi:hypothetical protein
MTPLEQGKAIIDRAEKGLTHKLSIEEQSALLYENTSWHSHLVADVVALLNPLAPRKKLVPGQVHRDRKGIT